MSWTDLIQDETGKEIETHDHGRFRIQVGGPSGIPENIVRTAMTGGYLRTVNFKKFPIDQ